MDNTTKICCKCKTEKSLDQFSQKSVNPPRLQSRCKECRRIEYAQNKEETSRKRKEQRKRINNDPVLLARERENRRRRYLNKGKEQAKKWRAENRDKVNEAKMRSYYRNKEDILARQKAKRESDIEGFRAHRRATRQKNIERKRAYERDYGKKRRERDLHYRIVGNLRNRVRLAMEQKSECTKELLGCSIREFCDHLERQFKPGMSWDNYGSYWSIDHIIPCAKFDLTKEEEQRKCFHYTNCQPLTVSENSQKSSKMPTEFSVSNVTN